MTKFDDLAKDFGDEWAKKNAQDVQLANDKAAKEEAEKKRKAQIEDDVRAFAGKAHEVLADAQRAFETKWAKAKADHLVPSEPLPDGKRPTVKVENDKCEWIATLTIERPIGKITVGFARSADGDRNAVVAAHKRSDHDVAVMLQRLGKVPVEITTEQISDMVHSMLSLYRPK